MGRRRMIQKKLGLHRDAAHQASASWFRVRGRIDVSELVDAKHDRWHARDIDKLRWLSTVHLCGTGYWAWLIPLATGYWSVGIVCEEASHDFRTYSKPETARSWLLKHEPYLAKRLENVPFEDFIAMKDYRYDSARILSPQRWSCVGEAGIFVDPLYSPGSDFIALTNSCTTELIGADLRGELDPERVEELNRTLLHFEDLASDTLALGSQVFGKPEATAAKLYWDYVAYWIFTCQYFFQHIFALPVAEHRRFSAMQDRVIALNKKAQSVVQAWAEFAPAQPAVDHVKIPQFPSMLADLHVDLMEEKDPERTYRDMESGFRKAEEVLAELVLRALRRAGPSGAAELARKIGLAQWELPIDEQRLSADEAEPRQRRKLLPKAVRDMERAIGKSSPESAEAPKLRELLALAQAG
jgi:hypothetical protein